VDYVPYTGAHVVTQLQLLLFSGLAFFVMLNYLRRTLTITMDVDWFYRVPLANLARASIGGLSRAGYGLGAMIAARGRAVGARLYRHHGPEGILARTWPTGSMALWVMLMLLAYLVLYYI
jgi:multicomponent Na+:H+ antiporter subunit D